MSYTVYPYLVDLADLQRMFGCQDKQLLTTLEQENAEALHEDESPHVVWVARERLPMRQEVEPPPTPTLRQALREIIAGAVQDVEDEDHYWMVQYWRAVELLCAHIGARLPNEHFEAFSGIGILTELDGLQDLALHSRSPLIALPPSTDFPAVTYLTCDEASETLARFPIVELAAPFSSTGWEQWDEPTRVLWGQEWPLRLRVQYRGWLEAAVRSGRTLIAFLD